MNLTIIIYSEVSTVVIIILMTDDDDDDVMISRKNLGGHSVSE
jgi:hypothetical protein